MDISALIFLLLNILLHHTEAVDINVNRLPWDKPVEGAHFWLADNVYRAIPNWSIIHASQFFDYVSGVGVVNAFWCQSSSNDVDAGRWYYPTGVQIPIYSGKFGDRGAPSPLYTRSFAGRVALARKGGLSENEGLYTCVIKDHLKVNHVLVVGIYTDGNYRTNTGPRADSKMTYALASSRIAIPFLFTLSFNVESGPPTYVNCYVGNKSNRVNITVSRAIVNGGQFISKVTATVSERITGTYICEVTNGRVIGGAGNGIIATSSSSAINLTVIATPSQVVITRVKTSVKLTWSKVPEADRYEVVYQLSKTSNRVSAGSTTLTTLVVASGLILSESYDFFVVAYSSKDKTLPSAFSEKVSIIPWPTTTFTGPGNIINPQQAPTTTRVLTGTTTTSSSSSSTRGTGNTKNGPLPSTTPTSELSSLSTIETVLFIGVPIVWGVGFFIIAISVTCIVHKT